MTINWLNALKFIWICTYTIWKCLEEQLLLLNLVKIFSSYIINVKFFSFSWKIKETIIIEIFFKKYGFSFEQNNIWRRKTLKLSCPHAVKDVIVTKQRFIERNNYLASLLQKMNCFVLKICWPLSNCFMSYFTKLLYWSFKKNIKVIWVFVKVKYYTVFWIRNNLKLTCKFFVLIDSVLKAFNFIKFVHNCAFKRVELVF